MRKIIYLTQDEIDDMAQKGGWIARDYNSLRALQDGLIKEFTTAFIIYRRKEE